MRTNCTLWRGGSYNCKYTLNDKDLPQAVGCFAPHCRSFEWAQFSLGSCRSFRNNWIAAMLPIFFGSSTLNLVRQRADAPRCRFGYSASAQVEICTEVASNSHEIIWTSSKGGIVAQTLICAAGCTIVDMALKARSEPIPSTLGLSSLVRRLLAQVSIQRAFRQDHHSHWIAVHKFWQVGPAARKQLPCASPLPNRSKASLGRCIRDRCDQTHKHETSDFTPGELGASLMQTSDCPDQDPQIL